MMEGKTKMIKGLIYDDKDMAEMCTEKTIDRIECAYEDAINLKRKDYPDCPNLDEYKASSYINALINYKFDDTTERNLIIPSSLIHSEDLYKELKKIDIGEDVLHGFIYSRLAKYKEQLEKRYIYIKKFDNKTGKVVTSEKFVNISDAIKYVTEEYENNKIDEETLTVSIKAILEHADDITWF